MKNPESQIAKIKNQHGKTRSYVGSSLGTTDFIRDQVSICKGKELEQMQLINSKLELHKENLFHFKPQTAMRFSSRLDSIFDKNSGPNNVVRKQSSNRFKATMTEQDNDICVIDFENK